MKSYSTVDNTTHLVVDDSQSSMKAQLEQLRFPAQIIPAESCVVVFVDKRLGTRRLGRCELVEQVLDRRYAVGEDGYNGRFLSLRTREQASVEGR